MSNPSIRKPTWSARAWRCLQAGTVSLGVALLVLLILQPQWGVRLFWNLLIPAIPALALFVPGWWRNACPLGTVANLGQRSGRTTGRRLSLRAQGWLSVGSVSLLALVLPARHLLFDTNGHATAALLIGMTLVAMALGWRFAGKSGWCAGLCPVGMAERLYGQVPAVQTRNAHCVSCSHCVALCPDSIRSMVPRKTSPTTMQRWADRIMAGGFVGFVWGWFQVPDAHGSVVVRDIVFAYGMPLLGAAASLSLFMALRHALPEARRPILVRAFAAAAISCYYWYRLPMMLGFGHIPGDGVLVDLSTWFPGWITVVSRVLTTSLVLSWLIGRGGELTWMLRPVSTRPAAPAPQPVSVVRVTSHVTHDTLQTLS